MKTGVLACAVTLYSGLSGSGIASPRRGPTSMPC